MKNDRTVQLVATDLAHHLACRHLTELERGAAEGGLTRPYRDDPGLKMLIRRGLEHEQAYVGHLRDLGKDVVGLREVEGGDAVERTRTAMRAGRGVIVQAALADGRWQGRVDVLERVDNVPSDLGNWSYEPVDTKLARQTRGEAVLQLALYSDLVRVAQRVAPRSFYVVKPARDAERPSEKESFRLADYEAYCRLVRRKLEEWVDTGDGIATYPNPVAHCDICPWWSRCDRQRHDDDHLSLVAGLQALHREELNRQGISTLTEFAEREEALHERPDRGSRDTFDRLHGQARIQLEGRRTGEPRYEMLPVEPERGLTRLPEPCPGDVFFDIESDRFFEDMGLEFLFGYVILDQNGEPEYQSRWAVNPAEEKRMFEDFLDFLMERWERFPGMHVYHFTPYEPAALKRLMGRYATREDQVDRLLRGRRLIDVHAVTRQGLRASVESYSLKELEPFFGFERQVELPDARRALQRVECALEMRAVGQFSAADKEVVQGYNREDCLSTLRLREWLEERRSELTAAGTTIVRPELKDGVASDHLEERRIEVQEVFDALTEDLPGDQDAWTDIQQGRSLLAHLLDYFRREDKCAWWEIFRLSDLEHEDLLDERKAVTGLEFVSEVGGGTTKCPVHRYRFPDQEVSLDPGDPLLQVGDRSPLGKVYSVDQAARTIDIKKRQDTREHHAAAVLANERVSPEALERSLLALARAAAEDGLDGDGAFRAGRDLLLRRLPRIEGGTGDGAALRRDGESAVEAAMRLAPKLQDSYLPIQGPPGAGKTFTGGQIIARLVEQGKRVGVTAVSHKVIRNLLQAAIEAGDELGVPVEAVHKPGTRGQDEETEKLKHASTSARALAALDTGKVVGGTCWLWSVDEAMERLDYLFVDEAGQLSLAMMLAAARSSRNLVLLGDPQQLEQPQQGSHPEGAAVSALEHVLGEASTIPDDRGLFLDRTWRLHPSICQFTSEAYYDGRLESRPGLEAQAIDGETRFRGSGLFLEQVDHTGNQNRSLEEVERIREIVSELLAPGVGWIDDKGTRHPLSPDDILVIAPYNAQVGALIDRLPADVRVGTVDKFQGQQAPVLIYSMTSSSADEAPRGMSFLYNPNRLNVATSRARCIGIVVASPALLEPNCRTPTHMRWANALCRFRELAR